MEIIDLIKGWFGLLGEKAETTSMKIIGGDLHVHLHFSLPSIFRSEEKKQ